MQPTSQPTLQPTSQPTSQPTFQPSTQPTGSPTGFLLYGELSTVLHSSSVISGVTQLFSETLLACGISIGKKSSLSVCAQLNAVTGVAAGEFHFPWDTFVGMFSGVVMEGRRLSSVERRVVLVGLSKSDKFSSIASCAFVDTFLSCDVRTVQTIMLVDAAWVPLTNKLVRVGYYETYPMAMAVDEVGTPVWTRVFAVASLSQMSLLLVSSLPQFGGCVVTGFGKSIGSAPAVSIIVGWFHSDVGQMNSLVSITPVGALIQNTGGLINSVAIDETTLDALVAGSVRLQSNGHAVAYLVRCNPLFFNALYGVHYVSVLSDESSAAKAVVFAGSVAYVVCEVTSQLRNYTKLSVLKISATTGNILKQVRITGPLSIACSKLTLDGALLTIMCSLQKENNLMESLLFVVNTELTFNSLLPGYQRSTEVFLRVLNFPVTAQVLSVTQSSSVVTATSSTFSSRRIEAGSANSTFVPSLSPTLSPPTADPTVLAPTPAPSPLPSVRPSGQPTGSPTSAPSVSPAPTTVPSSATPSYSHRPSPLPTSQPSVSPTGQPSQNPSQSPNALPSTQPSSQPSNSPSTQPSEVPTTQPTLRPSAVPTGLPSTFPTEEPTLNPTSVPSSVVEGAETSDYVLTIIVACSAVTALLLFLCFRHRLWLIKVVVEKRKKFRKTRTSSVSPKYLSMAAILMKDSTRAKQGNSASSAELGLHKPSKKVCDIRNPEVVNNNSDDDDESVVVDDEEDDVDEDESVVGDDDRGDDDYDDDDHDASVEVNSKDMKEKMQKASFETIKLESDVDLEAGMRGLRSLDGSCSSSEDKFEEKIPVQFDYQTPSEFFSFYVEKGSALTRGSTHQFRASVPPGPQRPETAARRPAVVSRTRIKLEPTADKQSTANASLPTPISEVSPPTGGAAVAALRLPRYHQQKEVRSSSLFHGTKQRVHKHSLYAKIINAIFDEIETTASTAAKGKAFNGKRRVRKSNKVQKEIICTTVLRAKNDQPHL
jgi:hypothetical protein